MIFLAGYGMYAPCGHMDFYPNGGRVQPGCDQNLFQYIGDDGLYDGNASLKFGSGYLGTSSNSASRCDIRGARVHVHATSGI